VTPLATLVERAGFAPGTPVAVARVVGDTVEDHISGAWPNGRPVAPNDRFYVASLAKQVTGAALALLVRDGRIDPDRPVSDHIAGLPPWSARITPRQLAHHSSGLPPAGELEARMAGDWTDAFVFEALGELTELPSPPGVAHSYSNAGYVLLGRVIAEASDMPLAEFATARLLEPLGLDGIGFPSTPIGQPQLPLLGAHLPLTHGDGGLWSSARSLAQWLQQQNRDTLGIAHLVTTAGHLSDGSSVDYGWGLGLRRHCGEALLIHGGEWTGAAAKAVRSPALGIAVVGMAAGAPFETLNRLVSAVLEDIG
jgi:CubicO group peptidase (beta-lactamase class C family)